MKDVQRRIGRSYAATMIIALSCAVLGAGAASSQSYDAMSCDELWYARNAIYAAKGFCFKTSKAQQVFGPRCFPPYGELTSGEQAQVNLIRQVENAKGCSDGGDIPAPPPAPPPMPPPPAPPPGNGYSNMSCNQLWYARNAIYAAKGYCFKTERARRVFGPGCFPPYGRLSGAESARISAIKRWERAKGCP